MSTTNKFISSFGWNGLTVVLQVVIQLIYTSFLARLISQDAFGLMGIALTVVGFAEIFSQVGIGPALIQRKEINREHISGAFFISVFLGLSFTALFIFFAQPIADFYNDQRLADVIKVISLSFTISALGIIPRSLLIKAMNFKKFFIAGMVSIIGGNLIVGLTLAYLDFDVWAYVFALIAQNLLMTIAFWLLHPVRLKFRWHWPSTRELIRYGYGSTLFNALNYAGTRLDTLIVPYSIEGVGERSRMGQAGVYERSAYLMGLPVTILGKLSDNVMFSGLSQLQDEPEKLRKTFLGAIYFVSMLVIPGCTFLIFFAKEVVLIYLGDAYSAAIPVVQLLFIGVVFRAMIKLCDSIFRALDRLLTGSLIKFTFCSLIAIGIFMMVDRGLEAVAMAVVAATLVQFTLAVSLCMNIIGASWKNFAMALFSALRLALVVAIVSAPARYFFDAYEIPLLIALLIALTINGLAVLALAWFYPAVFGRGEQNVLRNLLLRLPKRGIIDALLKRMK